MNKLQIVLVLGLAVTPLVISPAPAEASGNGWNRYWQQEHAKQREAKHAVAQRTHRLAQAHKGKYDPATQALRKRMFAGKPLTEAQLKFLADKGESLAALRLGKMLQANGGSSDKALGYYAKAAVAGRTSAAEPMLTLLRAPDTSLAPATLAAAKKGLLAAVRKGDTKAMTGLAQLYLAGEPFGADQNAAVELLVLAAKRGDENAAFEAGLMLSEPGSASADETKAAEMFKIAAKHGNLIAMSKLEAMAKQ
jgi:TPR repeat protein